jgi:hypothetical protein
VPWHYIIKPVNDKSVLDHQAQNTLEKARLSQENRMYQDNLERLVQDDAQSGQ